VPYEVRLTDDAAADLEDLFSYIARHDALQSAEAVLDHLDATFASLSRQPQRGAYPAELSELGIHDYREVFFKPYRIIYRIIRKTVYVYVIVDGRRDMQTLLKRRLLAGA
jgi:toxin ParE1/3/4